MLPIKNCIFPLLSGVLLFSAGAQTPLQISTTSVPVASQYQSYNTTLAPPAVLPRISGLWFPPSACRKG